MNYLKFFLLMSALCLANEVRAQEIASRKYQVADDGFVWYETTAKEGGLYGAEDANKNTIIPPVYKVIYYSANSAVFYVRKEDMKQGIYDTYGNMLIPLTREYKQILALTQDKTGTFFVCTTNYKDEKRSWDVCDANGNVKYRTKWRYFQLFIEIAPKGNKLKFSELAIDQQETTHLVDNFLSGNPTLRPKKSTPRVQSESKGSGQSNASSSPAPQYETPTPQPQQHWQPCMMCGGTGLCNGCQGKGKTWYGNSYETCVICYGRMHCMTCWGRKGEYVTY